MLYNKKNRKPNGKSLGEDLMAEVLGGAIPVQRHLPDPATKFT